MFGRGFTLFRLMGFEVRLDWSWLLLAALLTWSLARAGFPSFVPGLSLGTYWWMGAAGMLVLFVSIVLHEFGHALVARRYAIPVHDITLFVFGGVAEMEDPPNPKLEALLAIAGPLTSLLWAAIGYGLRRTSEVWHWPAEVRGLFAYWVWVNLALAAFNLIPAFPLDGGRVLRSILWAAKKRLTWATRVAATMGTGFAFLLMGGGILNCLFGNFITGLWCWLIGMFIRSASRMAYQEVMLRRTLEGQPVAHFMNPHPVTVPPATSLKDVVENYVDRYNFDTFPVVEDGHFLGCISLKQLKLIPRQKWEQCTAQTVARPCEQGRAVSPGTQATEALARMNRMRTRRLMVVDQDRLVGVIALADLLNLLSRKMEMEGGLTGAAG